MCITRSCEDSSKIYITFFNLRFIFQNGKYIGWYNYVKGPKA